MIFFNFTIFVTFMQLLTHLRMWIVHNVFQNFCHRTQHIRYFDFSRQKLEFRWNFLSMTILMWSCYYCWLWSCCCYYWSYSLCSMRVTHLSCCGACHLMPNFVALAASHILLVLIVTINSRTLAVVRAKIATGQESWDHHSMRLQCDSINLCRASQNAAVERQDPYHVKSQAPKDSSPMLDCVDWKILSRWTVKGTRHLHRTHLKHCGK